MFVYLMGLVDILAAIFLVVQPKLSLLVWITMVGLLYKFAVSFFYPGISLKMLGLADLFAAISLFTGYGFGALGLILTLIHAVKGMLSFMGLPLFREPFFFFTRMFSRSFSETRYRKEKELRR